jgi:hypothetical protein
MGLLLFVLSAPLPAAKILKVGKGGKAWLISQKKGSKWKKGETVCVRGKRKAKACGRVVKSTAKRAVVKIKRAPKFKVKAGKRVFAKRGKKRRGKRKPASMTNESTFSAKGGGKKFSRAQVSLELLGSAILYSLQGSYRVTKPIAINLGFSYYSLSSTSLDATSTSSVSILQFPASVSYFLLGQKHIFEVFGGADVALVSGSVNSNSSGINGSVSGGGSTIIPTLGLGYRRWPAEGGFHMRISGYLFFVSGITPWVGITLGAAL